MDNFMYYWVPLLAVILIGLITIHRSQAPTSEVTIRRRKIHAKTGLARREPRSSFPCLPSIALPAIVADADAYTDAGSSEANSRPRPIIPVAVAAALDVAFARRIIVGIFDNDAAAALGAITAPALVADQANLLDKFRVRILVAGIDVSGICAARKQRYSARQERNREFPHGDLLVRSNAARRLRSSAIAFCSRALIFRKCGDAENLSSVVPRTVRHLTRRSHRLGTAQPDKS